MQQKARAENLDWRTLALVPAEKLQKVAVSLRGWGSTKVYLQLHLPVYRLGLLPVPDLRPCHILSPHFNFQYCTEPGPAKIFTSLALEFQNSGSRQFCKTFPTIDRLQRTGIGAHRGAPPPQHPFALGRQLDTNVSIHVDIDTDIDIDTDSRH